MSDKKSYGLRLPEEHEGGCNALLSIGDGYVRCWLPSNHEGLHEDFYIRNIPEKTEPSEEWPHNPYRYPGKVTITWENDVRYLCNSHGLQPKDDCEICSESAREYLNTYECPKCYGMGYPLDKDASVACACCQGTGYDPKFQEKLEEALKNKIPLWAYVSRTWS